MKQFSRNLAPNTCASHVEGQIDLWWTAESVIMLVEEKVIFPINRQLLVNFIIAMESHVDPQ